MVNLLTTNSSRVILRAQSNTLDIQFHWNGTYGIELNSETLDLGPIGAVLIIKRNVLHPGQNIQLQLSAR